MTAGPIPISLSLSLLALLSLLSLFGCGAATRAEGGDAAACSVCHAQGFAVRDAEELAAKIRAIRDGERRHPPLRLDNDSDAAVAELAERPLSER